MKPASLFFCLCPAPLAGAFFCPEPGFGAESASFCASGRERVFSVELLASWLMLIGEILYRAVAQRIGSAQSGA